MSRHAGRHSMLRAHQCRFATCDSPLFFRQTSNIDDMNVHAPFFKNYKNRALSAPAHAKATCDVVIDHEKPLNMAPFAQREISVRVAKEKMRRSSAAAAAVPAESASGVCRPMVRRIPPAATAQIGHPGLPASPGHIPDQSPWSRKSMARTYLMTFVPKVYTETLWVIPGPRKRRSLGQVSCHESPRQREAHL